jgi:two-component system NarL family response regulator
MLQHRIQLLLLDFDLTGLDSPRAIVQLRNLNPATGIVVLSDPVAEQVELELFKAGARGHCSRDIDPQLLKRIVVAIRLGELWIRRSMVPRLLDELGMRFAGATPDRRSVIGRLAFLTDREREIAALVGNGGSNKQIARQLDISERTVKAHLTEIFRKLGIADRLRLALLLASNQGLPAASGNPQT